MQFSCFLACVAFSGAATELKMSKMDALSAVDVFTYYLRIEQTKWAERYLRFHCSHLQNRLCAMRGSCWTCYKGIICSCKACGFRTKFNNCDIFVFVGFFWAAFWAAYCWFIKFNLVKICCNTLAFTLKVWNAGAMILKSLIKGLNNLLS